MPGQAPFNRKTRSIPHLTFLCLHSSHLMALSELWSSTRKYRGSKHMNIRHNEGTLSLQRTRAIRAIPGTMLVVIAIKARPVLICTLVPILIAEMPANWWSLLDGSCGSVRHGVLARSGVDVAGQIQTGIIAKHDNTNRFKTRL